MSLVTLVHMTPGRVLFIGGKTGTFGVKTGQISIQICVQTKQPVFFCMAARDIEYFCHTKTVCYVLESCSLQVG